MMTAINTIAVWVPFLATTTASEAGSIVAMASATTATPQSGDFILDSARSAIPPPPPGLRHSLFAPTTAREEYLLGLLARTQNGHEVLGVTKTLSGGHIGIGRAMENLFGEIGRFLWGGELVVRPTRDGHQLTDANETSGYLAKLQQRREPSAATNAVTELEARLRTKTPVPIAPGMRFAGFGIAPLHYHPIVATIPGNLRHDLGNVFFPLADLFEEIKGLSSVAKIQKALQEMIGKIKSLKSFCKLIEEEDPMMIPDVGRFIRQLEKIEQDRELTLEEYRSLSENLAAAQKIYEARLYRNQNNRYDLFIFDEV